jgi:hypothetical protein
MPVCLSRVVRVVCHRELRRANIELQTQLSTIKEHDAERTILHEQEKSRFELLLKDEIKRTTDCQSQLRVLAEEEKSLRAALDKLKQESIEIKVRACVCVCACYFNSCANV